MPVLVERDDWEVWLATDAVPGDLHPLLMPPVTAPLTVRRVSSRVNDVRSDGPELLDTAPPPPEPLQLF
jgi:putative SOS response-associated peptidase YedK